jgi:ribosomal protein S18 acetylase RimI-like enzyme
MDAIVRPARLDDAHSLHRHCYPEQAYNDVRDYLAWCLRQAGKGWIVRLVAEVDGQAVGNAQLTRWGESGEIGSLVVSPGYRRCGLARKLLVALIEEAHRRGLETLELRAWEGQTALLAFYERMGFCRVEETAETRGPEPDKEDGLFHPARTMLLRMQR